MDLRKKSVSTVIKMKTIDLSHQLFNAMPTYPSDPELDIECIKNINNNNTLLHRLSMGTHTGTHIDAPSHILKNGKYLDEFNISDFMGKAVKVDLQTYKNVDIHELEFSGIIFDLNWSENFKNPNTFYGKKRPEIPLDFIESLLNTNIKFFGCDLPSVDQSGSKKKSSTMLC